MGTQRKIAHQIIEQKASAKNIKVENCFDNLNSETIYHDEKRIQ